MFDWVQDFENWLVQVVKDVWTAVSDLYHDMALELIKKVLEVVAEVAKLIPVPQWMSDYSLGHLFGMLSPTLGYFVDRLGLSVGIPLLGLGYAFRVGRKLLTAFQW